MHWLRLATLGLLSAAAAAGPPPAATHPVGRRKSRPPLLEGNDRRKGLKQTHCHFGNQSYELEERWRPDLGPPFGVLYCVRCECVALQRKNRIVARARCENIKNDCPKPVCENPVLLPERCCKICPGEDGAGLEEDLAVRKLESDDDDKNIKEFSVLLTGRGLSPTVPTAGAARAYLTFSKRSLHYSIHSANLDRPNVVRFMDHDENILEEHEVPSPHHHVNSSKVCGVWNKVPKVYRRLLQKERLVLALANEKQPDGMVAGKILRNMRINKEVFSSLLVTGSTKNKVSLGGGGVAIVSTERNCVYIVLEFNGIFLPSDGRNVPLYVQIVYDDPEEGRQITVASTVSVMAKVHPEFNSANVKIDLSQEAQQQMALGQLRLRLSARDDSLFLHGPITPKVTCNVFQATLIGSGAEAAVALVALQSTDGTLSYQMELGGSTKDFALPLTIRLETEDPTKKELRTLVTSNDTQVLDNTVRGTFPRALEQVEMLMADDLFLSITFGPGAFPTSQRNKVLGRVRQRLYTDAFVTEIPVMLLPTSGNMSAVGQAWLTVDKDCDLHYALYAAGLAPEDKEEKERHLLELQEVPISPKYGVPQQRLLQRLNVDEAEGIQENVNLITLARMKVGQVSLTVSSKAPGRGKIPELKSRALNLPIPITCLPRQEISQAAVGQFLDDESNDIHGADPTRKCFYEGDLYEDGAQWKAQHDHCTMCSCQRGRVVCDKMLCPKAPCEVPVILPNQCCGVCLGEQPANSTAISVKPHRGCYFEGDKTFHLAGSSWHPYIPPFGFSRCALCTCETDTLAVECKRITCPPLPCPEKEAFREHPLACCKQCPNFIPVKSTVIVVPGQLGDQGSQKTLQEIISAGGSLAGRSIVTEAITHILLESNYRPIRYRCTSVFREMLGCDIRGQLYANGDSWHPTVQPYGEMKCINCHCKDGRSRCKRQKCPKLICTIKLTSDTDCCPRCAESVPKRKSSGGAAERRPDKTRKTRDRKSHETKDNSHLE